MIEDRTFRDFMCMYVGEGSKRSRNNVAICNSDPSVVVLGDRWLRRLSQRPVKYSLQYHADQDLEALKEFWAELLEVETDAIRFQRKSNSNQLKGRAWRSVYGVLSVRTSDTYLRARLQAWMDRVAQEWLA